MIRAVFGCVRYWFKSLPVGQKVFQEVLPWSELEKHLGERGFCDCPCAESGKLVWLHYYNEGSLTYCSACGHYGVLVRGRQ